MGVRRPVRRLTVDLSSVGRAEVGPVAGVSLEWVTPRVGCGVAGPQAKFVITHRDPALVIPSVATLVDSLAPPNRLDQTEWRHYLGASLTQRWAEATDRLVTFRDRMGDERLFDLGFDDVMRDPLGAVGRLYTWLVEDLTPAATSAMSAWLDLNVAERSATGTVTYRARPLRPRRGRHPLAVRELPGSIPDCVELTKGTLCATRAPRPCDDDDTRAIMRDNMARFLDLEQ